MEAQIQYDKWELRGAIGLNDKKEL